MILEINQIHGRVTSYEQDKFIDLLTDMGFSVKKHECAYDENHDCLEDITFNYDWEDLSWDFAEEASRDLTVQQLVLRQLGIKIDKEKL